MLLPNLDLFLSIKDKPLFFFFFFSSVGYVEERPWWPIHSPNKGRKKKSSS